MTMSVRRQYNYIGIDALLVTRHQSWQRQFMAVERQNDFEAISSSDIEHQVVLNQAQAIIFNVLSTVLQRLRCSSGAELFHVLQHIRIRRAKQVI